MFSRSSSESSVEAVKSEPVAELGEALSELEALKTTYGEFGATIQKLTDKVEKMLVEKTVPKKKEVSEPTWFDGSWRIVSSIGMKEFIRKWRPSPLNDAIFQTGTQNIEWTGNIVSMYGTIGCSRHWSDQFQLGVRYGNHRMFLEANMLVLIHLKNEVVQIREEYFLRDGQLHVVTERAGVKCTRIYEKVDAERQVMDARNLMKQIGTQYSEEDKLRAMVSFLTKENAVLKAVIQETKTPIKSAILGSWDVFSPRTVDNFKPVFTMKKIHGEAVVVQTNGAERLVLVERNSKNVYNDKYFMHTFVARDHLVTEFIDRETGRVGIRIDRSMDESRLKIERTQTLSPGGSEKQILYLKKVDNDADKCDCWLCKMSDNE